MTLSSSESLTLRLRVCKTFTDSIVCTRTHECACALFKVGRHTRILAGPFLVNIAAMKPLLMRLSTVIGDCVLYICMLNSKVKRGGFGYI